MSYRNRKEEVWEKGREIKDKNPNVYRKDKFGNVMFKPSYGKTSKMGWEIDHSKAKARGGTDHLNNLQPMNTKANRQKGAKRI